MLDINNYYEKLVSEQLWKIIQNAKQPPSQSFLEDVACVALNNLPTFYVRSLVDVSSHLSDVDHEKMKNAVVAAVETAVEKVRMYPHDDREN